MLEIALALALALYLAANPPKKISLSKKKKYDFAIEANMLCSYVIRASRP